LTAIYNSNYQKPHAYAWQGATPLACSTAPIFLRTEKSNRLVEKTYLINAMHAEFHVGVGVFVFDPVGKFIVGKRKGSYGAGIEIPSVHFLSQYLSKQ
jgi:hypothetical protein